MAITQTHSRMVSDVDAGSTYATTSALAAKADTSSLGTAAPLNVGTSASNVVQLDGSAKLPAVDGSALTGVGGGTRTLLNTQTITSNAATVDFNSLLTATYTRYEFEAEHVVPTTDDTELYVLVKTAGDAVQSSTYNWTFNWQGASDGTLINTSGEAGTYIHACGGTNSLHGLGSGADEAGGSFTIKISTPSSSSRHTLIMIDSVWEGAGNAVYRGWGAGEYGATTAVTGLQVKFAAGSVASGIFRLYGVNAS